MNRKQKHLPFLVQYITVVGPYWWEPKSTFCPLYEKWYPRNVRQEGVSLLEIPMIVSNDFLELTALLSSLNIL